MWCSARADICCYMHLQQTRVVLTLLQHWSPLAPQLCSNTSTRCHLWHQGCAATFQRLSDAARCMCMPAARGMDASPFITHVDGAWKTWLGTPVWATYAGLAMAHSLVDYPLRNWSGGRSVGRSVGDRGGCHERGQSGGIGRGRLCSGLPGSHSATDWAMSFTSNLHSGHRSKAPCTLTTLLHGLS
jgi:hypothetical protein